MYKYLPITTNLQEMMVMLKSLPAYTLVFDERSYLVDLNKPALQFLKMNSIQEFNCRKDDVFPTNDYIKTIIHELKKGKMVRHAKTLLNYADDNQVVVELCACMINGCKELFLFQLFELSLSTNSSLGSFSSYANTENQDIIIYSCENWDTNAKKVVVASTKNKNKERWSKRLTETSSIQHGELKRRKLTKIEETVNALLELNLSVPQIANVTNKKDMAIRSIIRRIVEKQRINSIEGSIDEVREYSFGSNASKKDELNIKK